MAISVPSATRAVPVLPESEPTGKPSAAVGGSLFGKLLNTLIASSTTPATTTPEATPLLPLPVESDALADSTGALIAGGALLPAIMVPPVETPPAPPVPTTHTTTTQAVAAAATSILAPTNESPAAQTTVAITPAKLQPPVIAEPTVTTAWTPTEPDNGKPVAVDVPVAAQPPVAPKLSDAPPVTLKVPLQTPIVVELQPREATSPAIITEGVAAAGSVAASSSATVGARLMGLVANVEVNSNPQMKSMPRTDASDFQAVAARVAPNVFENAASQVGAAPVDTPAQARNLQPVPVMEQIAERLLPHIRSAADGSHEVRIQLNPVSLGEVKVHLAVADGGVQGSIMASSDAARAAIEQSLPELRQRLEAMGVTVGPMDVSTQSSGSGDARRFVPPAFDDSSAPTAAIRRSAIRRTVHSAGHRIDVTA